MPMGEGALDELDDELKDEKKSLLARLGEERYEAGWERPREEP